MSNTNNNNPNDLMNGLFAGQMKAYGIHAFVPDTMEIPPSRQLAAPGAAPSTQPEPDAELMLVAKVTIDRIAGDHFTKIRAILAKPGVADGMFTSVESNPKALRYLEQHKYRAAGPHVMVTVDVQAPAGFLKAEQIASHGLPLRKALKGTKWENTRWVMSNDSWITGKDGRTTIILTPKALPSFWEAIGYRPNGKPATVAKRNRRSMADGPVTFEGTVSKEVPSIIYFEDGNGRIQQHPCLDVVYQIDTIILKGQTREVDGKRIKVPDVHKKLRYPHAMTVGYVRMDDSAIANKILALTDGAHVVDQARLNAALQLADAGFPQYLEGDGIRFTLDGAGHGQTKGHAVARFLDHRTMLSLDTKQEFTRIDGRFSFVVMGDLHRPSMARMDAQMTINFRLAEGGLVEKYGLAWTDRIHSKVGNPEDLTEMFLTYLKDSEILLNASDAIDGYAEGVSDADRRLLQRGKTSWVLGANARLSKEQVFAVSSNGECSTLNYNMTNGKPIDMWQINRLASRAFRHLTETLLDGEKGRIPVPESEALRAYAMFDASIMDHPNKRFSGKGFFLSNGVLKGSEGLVFHGQGRGQDRVTAMVRGAACTNRQPSGWVGQMDRMLQLVGHQRYTRMKRSPFLYLSCDLIPVVDAMEAYLVSIVGRDMLDKVLKLWGTRVPYIVICNLIVGGGDLDDLHFVWIGQEPVAYLRSQFMQDLVSIYPDEPIKFASPAGAAASVRPGNRYAAATQQKITAASLHYDRMGFHSEIKRTSKGGLIAPLTNANLIWTERWNSGDPLPVNMGGYNRRQEEIIDAEVKHGTDIGGGRAKSDELFKSITRCSRFLVHRIPAYIREKLTNLEVVDSPLDMAYAVLRRSVADLLEVFEAYYLVPGNNLKIDYLVTCPVTLPAMELGRRIKTRWNEVREAARDSYMGVLNGPLFNACTAREKSNFAIGESVKQADVAILQEIMAPLYATDRQLVISAVIAIYKEIANAPISVDPDTHLPRPVADAILYQTNFNAFLREAMRYAKCVAQFPAVVELDLDATLDPALVAFRKQGAALTAARLVQKASSNIVVANEIVANETVGVNGGMIDSIPAYDGECPASEQGPRYV